MGTPESGCHEKGRDPVDGFTDDNGLGMSYYALFMRYLGLKAFGGNQGDKVSYQVKLKESYQDRSVSDKISYIAG